MGISWRMDVLVAGHESFCAAAVPQRTYRFVAGDGRAKASQRRTAQGCAE